jgi:hypothetical protein
VVLVELLMQEILQEEQVLLKDKTFQVQQVIEDQAEVEVELNMVIKDLVLVHLVLLVETVKYNTDS